MKNIKATTTTKTFFTINCPCCGDSTQDVTDRVELAIRLSIMKPSTAVIPPTTCQVCHAGYKGTIDSAGNAKLTETKEGDVTHSEVYRVTMLPPRQEMPLFLVSKTQMKMDSYDSPLTSEQMKQEEYYINEHTCPTNWLSDVEQILLGDEEDPHGAFRFCAMFTKKEIDEILAISSSASVEEVLNYEVKKLYDFIKEVVALWDTDREKIIAYFKEAQSRKDLNRLQIFLEVFNVLEYDPELDEFVFLDGNDYIPSMENPEEV